MAHLHEGFVRPARNENNAVKKIPARETTQCPSSRAQLSRSPSATSSSACIVVSSGMSSGSTVGSGVEDTAKPIFASLTDARDGKVVSVLLRYFLRSVSSYCLSFGPDILLAVPLVRRKNVDLFLTEAQRVIADAQVSELNGVSTASLQTEKELFAALIRRQVVQFELS